MTPIYASNRACLSGWYVYNLPTVGMRVFWDAGAGKRDNGETGFWDPYSGVAVDAPDDTLNNMPNICLDCILKHDGNVVVTGMPSPAFLDKIMDESKIGSIESLYDDEQNRPSFFDELTMGRDLLEGTVCSMVEVTQLPHDDAAALSTFRSEFGDGLARHPWSVWSAYRSAWFAANYQPTKIEGARVRKVKLDKDKESVESVDVWATPERELKLTPLYIGDDDPDCPLWKIKQTLTLFCVEDIIIGYE